MSHHDSQPQTRLLHLGPEDDPPEWRQLRDAFDWVRAMQGCPQDPEWHAEGDVAVHTEMVLAHLPPPTEPDARWVVWLASLLHDVAKPLVTRRDAGGRITSRGHSSAGAIVARSILWRAHVPGDTIGLHMTATRN